MSFYYIPVLIGAVYVFVAMVIMAVLAKSHKLREFIRIESKSDVFGFSMAWPFVLLFCSVVGIPCVVHATGSALIDRLWKNKALEPPLNSTYRTIGSLDKADTDQSIEDKKSDFVWLD